MNSYNELWETVLSFCRENMNSIAFNMWIDPLKLIKIEAERVIVSAPAFKIDLIMTKYKSFIEDAFYNVMGFNVELEIIPEENISKENITKERILQKRNFLILKVLSLLLTTLLLVPQINLHIQHL